MSSNVDDQEKDSTQDSPYGMFVEMNPLVFVMVSIDEVAAPPPPPPKPVKRATSSPSAYNTRYPPSTTALSIFEETLVSILVMLSFTSFVKFSKSVL